MTARFEGGPLHGRVLEEVPTLPRLLCSLQEPVGLLDAEQVRREGAYVLERAPLVNWFREGEAPPSRSRWRGDAPVRSVSYIGTSQLGPAVYTWEPAE